MKANKIIMACSMLALIAPMSACDGQKMGDKEAFEKCYSLSYPAMNIGNDWLELAKDIRPTNITKMESEPFDYKWSYSLECETTLMPGEYVDMGSEYQFVTVANANASVCFCQTWQNGELILTWTK